MRDRLLRIWHSYNLSIVLFACFMLSWVMHAWTGWRKFSAEQLQHQQTPTVFGNDGYIWDFAASTFENWQSEFLQLLAATSLRIQSGPRIGVDYAGPVWSRRKLRFVLKRVHRRLRNR